MTMETIMSKPEQREMIRMRQMALLDYRSDIMDAEARGEARGADKNAVENIKSLINNLKLSPQAAMDALSIPADKRIQYASMLSVQNDTAAPAPRE